MKTQKVVVLSELRRAIIYTTQMSKQVTQGQHGTVVHRVPYELRCHADTPPEVSMLDGDLTNEGRKRA